jgi:hypothetical protein
MTESNYWSKLRKLLAKRIYAWKIQASYERGVPDWWGSGMYQDLWVENKRIANDAMQPPVMLDLTDTDKYLTRLQQLWLESRHAEGRHVGVIVFSKVGHVYLPDLSFQAPISRLAFMDAAMPMPELADLMVEICGENELK